MQLARFMVSLRVEGKAVFPPAAFAFVPFPARISVSPMAVLPMRASCTRFWKIGAGRSDAAKTATCSGLFDIMKAHFTKQFERQGLALSLELNEFSEAGTLKHNNLHGRFKQA